MSKLSTSDAYTSVYDKKTVYDNIKGQTAQFNPTFTSIGAALAIPTFGASLLIGGALDLGIWGNAKSKARDAQKKYYKGQIDEQNQVFKDYTLERNQGLSRTQNFINNTRSNFNATFGNGSFEELDTMYKRMLSGYSMSELLGNADQWDINSIDKDLAAYEEWRKSYDQWVMDGEDPATKPADFVDATGNLSMLFDGLSQDEINHMLTSSMSIYDINDSYRNYLYEKWGNGDTLYQRQLAQASRTEEYQYEQYRQSLNATAQQYSNQMQSAVAESRAANVTGAEQMGSIESEAGSSGIRQTGSGRNSINLQNYSTMVQAVKYASAISYLTDSYRSQLESANAGYLYQSFSTRNSIAQSKQQQLQNYVTQGNEMNRQLGEYYYSLSKLENDAASAYANVKSYRDAIEDVEVDGIRAKRDAVNNTVDGDEEEQPKDLYNGPVTDKPIKITDNMEFDGMNGVVVDTTRPGTQNLPSAYATPSEQAQTAIRDFSSMSVQELSEHYASNGGSLSWVMNGTNLRAIDEEGKEVNSYDITKYDNKQLYDINQIIGK